MVSNRYAKANNKYLPNFDPNKPSSYIIDLDVNNLYGHSMSQFLPHGGFKFVEDLSIFTREYILSLNPNGKQGYTLKVYLRYPKHLHDMHNDLPLAPEKKDITYGELSNYNKNILNNNKEDTTVESTKLVPNLYDKDDYVLDFRTLQFYLKLGMELVEVKEVVSYEQSDWMKSYIDFNSLKRKEAKNDFEKNFFKLANNAAYGKTLEDVRNRMTLTPVFGSQVKRFLKKVADPRLKNITYVDDNMVVVEDRKLSMVFSKPLFVGTTVLELSKLHMYEFHYNHMLKKYGHEKCKLLFTDTDSLCYYVETDDIYMDMLEDKSLYDLSDYPKDHFLYDATNKKVIGKMKDETNGIPIAEVAAIKAKMYALRTLEPLNKKEMKDKNQDPKYEKKTAKGIVKNVINRDFKFETYKSVIKNTISNTVTQKTIRSFKHNLYTIQQNKIGLSPQDTKRYLLDDGISSYAYGHYKIKEYNNGETD